MERILNIGRLRTTINGIAESITLSANSPLTLDIQENHFTFGIPNATSEHSGFMTSNDKSKLDGIAFGATDNIGTLTSVRINGLEISNSGPVDLPIADTHQYGLVKLSNSTVSDSEETVATSKALKATWDMAELKTANIGTITEIKLNGEVIGDYGSVDLGYVLREHQDISNKVDKIEGKGLSTHDFDDHYMSLVDTALQEHQDISHKVNDSIIGEPNGLATLDSEGKIPDSQIRSYTINVVEAISVQAFPEIGESQKIYIATGSNLIYRWNGEAYEELSKSLELGETTSTAYRGDRGTAAYNHSLIQSGNPHHVTREDIGLGNVPNVTTNDQRPTFTESSELMPIQSGETLSTILSKLSKVASTAIDDHLIVRNHVQNKNNPHEVSSEQIGLGNVKNIDQSKAISSLVKVGGNIEYKRLDGSSGVVQMSNVDNESVFFNVFEWEDGNTHNEDRIGLIVTLNRNKIVLAQNQDDYLLGIVSGNTDDPSYSKVAFFGQVICLDDGSSLENGYVAPGENGIATLTNVETKFRVLNRVDETHINVLINSVGTSGYGYVDPLGSDKISEIISQESENQND